MSIVLECFEIQSIAVPDLWVGTNDSILPGSLVTAVEPSKKVCKRD